MMKTPFYLYAVLFAICNFILSQQIRSQLVQDFLINEEMTPSSFIQKNVRIFPFRFNHYLAAWSDDRDGDASFYAQEFDESGNFIGNNFPVPSNSIIRYLSDGSFLVIKETITPGYYVDFITVYGYFYNSNNQILKTVTLTNTFDLENPIFRCISTENSYIFLSKESDDLCIWKYDSGGNQILQLQYSLYSQFSTDPINTIAFATNTRDEYAFIIPRINNQVFQGVYGTFYNDRDSIIADNQFLDYPIGAAEWYNYFLKAISLPDTTYLIFCFNLESAVVHFRKYNRLGISQGELDSLLIPHTSSYGVNISNFSVSQIYEDKYDVLITNREIRSSGYIDINTVYSFDSSGDYEGILFTDSILTLNVSESFIKTGDSTYIICMDDGNDAFLSKTNKFLSYDNIKLNDDQIGSNESNPLVLPSGPDHFFVIWNNGVEISGQKINFNGEKEGPPVALEGRTIESFSDGKYLYLWKRSNSTGQDTIGFTVYSNDWSVLQSGVIKTGSSGSLSIMLQKVISDSSFIVIVRDADNNNWQILLYDKDGLILKEKQYAGYISSVKIFVGNNTFWLKYTDRIRIFSKQLEELSEEFNATFFSLLLEDNKYLSLSSFRFDYGYPTSIYGKILTLSGDTIARYISFTDNADEYSCSSLNNDKFIFVFRTWNEISAKTYTNDGVLIKDSILIHSNTTGSKRQPAYALNGDKILFSWCEVRNPSLGYSIYGSIFNVSDLTTDVERSNTENVQEYKLYQNYPNPFNPLTNITFEIPKTGKLRLEIFDILGREVDVLVDGVKPSGKYTVQWNAARFPSGVYFCRIQTRNKSLIKKLVLIK